MELIPGNDITIITQSGCESFGVKNPVNPLAVAILQPFLDEYLAKHSEIGIDYVHGADTVREICAGSNAVGIQLCAMEKSALFPAVRKGGVLPRKTFSMGNANEKRYYMECRKIL